MEDLACYRKLMMIRILNLTMYETQETEASLVPSGLRVQSGMKIAVHHSITPEEESLRF